MLTMMINKRLIQMAGESKKYIIKNVILQWISLVCNIISIFLMGILLEHIFRGLFILPMIIFVAIVIVVMIGIRSFCNVKATKMSHLSTTTIKSVLRREIYEKLLKLGSGYHHKISTSTVVQVAVEGVEQLEIYMGRYLPQLFYSLIAPITLFIVLLFVNVKAAFILLVCVPLIPVSIIAISKIAKKLLHKYWSIYTGLGDHFLENLEGLTTLKIYGADEYKNKEMNHEAEEFRRITMKVLTMQLNSVTIMDLIAFGGAALGVIVAVSEFTKGNIEFYHAFVIIMLAAEFFIPMRLLGSYFHIAMNGMAASDKIFGLLDLEVEEKEEQEHSFHHMGLDMEGLTFSYNEERECLKEASIHVGEKEFVSIVGPSGSGKSTIASLFMGEHTNYKGNISIGGIDLRNLTEHEIMRKITYIGFQSYLFAGSIRSNLLLGKPEATEKELKNALAAVNLLDFVMSEGGLDMVVAEQGSNLSGGQRQRLAIARALLHDTDIYIFDEATSNIDSDSEKIICDVIQGLKVKKTILYITHRLSQVVPSDRIYVIKEGRVVEVGTHTKLYENRGIYHEMYETQHELEFYGV